MSIPDHVMESATRHAEHLKIMIHDFQINEVERERRFRSCPNSHKKSMEEKFDRERAREALSISQIREEQAMILAHEIRVGAVLKGPSIHKGAFQLSEKDKLREKPGTTTPSLNFLKDVYRKLEVVEPPKSRSAHQSPPTNV